MIIVAVALNCKTTIPRALHNVPRALDVAAPVVATLTTPGITPVQMPQGCPDAGTGLNGAPCLTGDQMDMFRMWVNACAPNN